VQEVASAIQKRAIAYLSRQYRMTAIVSIILANIILFFRDKGIKIAIGFLAGAFSSALAVYRDEYFGQSKYQDC
jgi:K(+)-stimulated pyrophosphate-energized sodium pump